MAGVSGLCGSSGIFSVVLDDDSGKELSVVTLFSPLFSSWQEVVSANLK